VFLFIVLLMTFHSAGDDMWVSEFQSFRDVWRFGRKCITWYYCAIRSIIESSRHNAISSFWNPQNSSHREIMEFFISHLLSLCVRFPMCGCHPIFYIFNLKPPNRPYTISFCNKTWLTDRQAWLSPEVCPLSVLVL